MGASAPFSLTGVITIANVSHASLTGSQLHEPKGAAAAALGQVYVANGSGSGTWTDIGTSSFTGMIADFVAPVAPTGWLELDGSVVSTSTYAGLYSVMSLQTSGTRTNANPVVTSIPSTANFKVGYYVFGTGISTGTTILSIDSATQVTLSVNTSSSGTSAFAVSPWLLNTGTVKLPDVTTAGRYRRSRTSTTKVGDLQTNQNKAHTHTVSVAGTTDAGGVHNHTINISDPTHSHTVTPFASNPGLAPRGVGNTTTQEFGGSTTISTNGASTGVTATSVSAGSHQHNISISGSAATDGGTEARPDTLIVLTCVKI